MLTDTGLLSIAHLGYIAILLKITIYIEYNTRQICFKGDSGDGNGYSEGGGAIFKDYYGGPVIINCTFYLNSAVNQGGGLLHLS